MSSTATSYIDRESEEIIDAYLRDDLLPPDLAQRVERLRAEGNSAQALEVLRAEFES